MYKEILKIRAHHFLCMQGFQGYGYNSSFTENMATIIDHIKNNCTVAIVNYCDDICKPCSNNINNTCKDFEKIKNMDDLVLEALKLNNNDIISTNETFKLVNETFKTIDAAYKICNNCSWKNICTWILSREGENID